MILNIPRRALRVRRGAFKLLHRGRNALCVAASCLLITSGAADALNARLANGQVVTVNSSAELQTTVRLLLANGMRDDARRLVRAFEPGHPDHAVRVAYVDGLAAAAEGNDVEAVRIFRSILAQRPELDLVRVQLVGAMARLDLDDGARAQAERLVAAGVDDKLDGQLSGLLRQLDANRPLSFRGYLSFLPSTNVNNGTDKSTVAIGPVTGVIPDDERRQSGLGIALGGQVAWRHQMTPSNAFIAALDGRVERFPSIDRTNTTGQLSLGVEHRLPRGKALFRLLTGLAHQDGDRTYRYDGLSIETNTRIGDRWRLYFGPEYRQETYDRTRGEDGSTFDLPVQLDRFAGPDSFVRFIAGATFGRKRHDRFSFDEARLGLGYYREMPMGFSGYAEVIAARRTYHDDFPGISDPRRDERLSFGVTVTKRDLVVAGFAPQVSLRATRTRSNAAFHDTTKTDLDIRLVKEF